ncbi:hypothetical protein BZG36_00847 [Bifiguratus adelaidae]|uniref:tRNA:m(4)X modification enzyme TRM13 n=1 Tax=Bifiguratus adelaidae TaxID=1938954 RepID=A0A261Y6H2_9FUNG|nr:hypothetical protein BZG36_00847 [Bifiguratus adelaidae]
MDQRARKKQKVTTEGTDSAATIPPPPDRPCQCHFYVSKKKRYCRLPTKATKKYCGEHLQYEEGGDAGNHSAKENGNTATTHENKKGERVPCPYDPAHSTYLSTFETHLLKCNSRPPDKQPSYYEKDVNISVALPEDQKSFAAELEQHRLKFMHKSMPWMAKVKLDALPFDELVSFCRRVQALAEEMKVEDIPEEWEDHSVMSEKRSTVSNTKHVDQQASLLGHLQNQGALPKSTDTIGSQCFVEFGAGKAELSYCVSKAMEKADSSDASHYYIFVDRKNMRNKFDSQIHRPPKAQAHRLLLDIKDLKLSGFDLLSESERNSKSLSLSAISKHLCGSATDLTLKCLANYKQDQEANGIKTPVKAIVIALCCHHICRFHMYPNQDFLRKHDIDEAFFARLAKMSSWAVSGARDEQHAKSEDEETENDDNTEENAVRVTTLLPSPLRFHLGHIAKRILDHGRMLYLRQCGFANARIVHYISRNTSLENVCLICSD